MQAINTFSCGTSVGAGGGVSGLTTGKIPKAASATSLADSLFSDDGTKVTAGGPVLFSDGTASAPGWAFASDPTSGMWRKLANHTSVSIGGATMAAFVGSGFRLNSGNSLSWSGGVADVTGADLFLYRDAANTLAQRNGTNAQAFRVYNTYTDASNYQRGTLKTSASGIEIAAETSGSGADDLDVTITPAGGGKVIIGSGEKLSSPGAMYLEAASFVMLVINGNQDLRTSNDNSNHLGAASARWANLFLARSIQGSNSKALTEGAATAVTQIAVPQTAGSNSADAVVQWTVYASDGTDTQTRRGSTYLAAVNKAGTETCTVGDIGTPVVAVSAGTLTCTTSCITGLTDVVQFALDCTSSLTQTSLNALVRLDMDQPNTVTPQ